MKKNLLSLLVIAALFLSSCKKDSGDDDDNYGTATNTWTFTEGGKTFKGQLLFDASLNTLLQGNNTYTYSMIGPERSSGFFFNVVLSLADLNFTKKNYQSGIDGDDHLNAFYYFEDWGTPGEYESSNLSPGPVMNFTVDSYNAGSDIVTISFSGQAKDASGNIHNITNGKVTAKNERL